MHLKSLLIVDDDLDLIMLLERDLVRHGFVVETAANLGLAEEILNAWRPAIVLLDVNVAGSDGRQLCWKIKQDPSQFARVIMMSGFDASASRSLLFGADDFIAKPFSLEFLRMKLSENAQASSVRRVNETRSRGSS